MTAPDVRTAARQEAFTNLYSHKQVPDRYDADLLIAGFMDGAVWGAALVMPAREQIAEALWCFPANVITLSELREKAATGNGDYEETLDYLMQQTDAVLALMRAQAGMARTANP